MQIKLNFHPTKIEKKMTHKQCSINLAWNLHFWITIKKAEPPPRNPYHFPLSTQKKMEYSRSKEKINISNPGHCQGKWGKATTLLPILWGHIIYYKVYLIRFLVVSSSYNLDIFTQMNLTLISCTILSSTAIGEEVHPEIRVYL